MAQYDAQIWNYFHERIGNDYGVAGLMGNLYAESGLLPNNLQNSFNTSLGYTDVEYTRIVDNKTYTKFQFVNDSAGYGLAQWTYWSRKQALYEMWISGGYSSIGSIELALDYLWYELQHDFPGVLSVLKTATSLRQASNKVLFDFESPADQGTSVQNKRVEYSQGYYDTYADTTPEVDPELALNYQKIESAIAWMLQIANNNSHGYDQDHRWGPDYDCSSLVIQAFEDVGVPVKTNGASYTGNMRSVFKNTGFTEIPFTTSLLLVRGDVLWRTGHTEVYLGNGQNVGAHINEFGEVTGGQTGDQTGNEISVSATGTNWTYVLRLPSSPGGGGSGDTPGGSFPYIPWGKDNHNFNFVLFNHRRKRWIKRLFYN